MELAKLIKGIFLGIFNVVIIWIALFLYSHGAYWILLLLLLGAALVNFIFISERGYPYRYLLPASFFMILLVVYPIIYTVYISVTNYGTGNILNKEQVIAQLEERYVRDTGSPDFSFSAYRDPQSGLWFLFTDSEGRQMVGHSGELTFVEQGDPLLGQLAGYTELTRVDVAQSLQELQAQSFSYDESRELRMRNINAFNLYEQQYSYDREKDVLLEVQTGTLYTQENGYFQAPDGTRLTPGFRAVIGFDNFRRLFGNPQVTGPFARVFGWTVQWALLSVATTFVVGLFLAILLNDPYLRFRKVYRSLLILPYAIP